MRRSAASHPKKEIRIEQAPSSVNADGIFEPFHIGQVPWEESSRGTRFGMRYQHLSSFGGGTQVSVSMEVLSVSVHTDTGRVSVKLTGEAYRQSATMAYWEGVDVDAKP